MKKLFKIGILTVISMFSLAIGVSASETVEEAKINLIESTPNNIGVSTEAPIGSALAENSTDEISPYGLGKPSTDNVVDLNDGKMKFSGEAKRSKLFTNNYFTGKSKVSYSITNYNDNELTVKVYTQYGIFATETIKVPANTTSTGTISDLNSSKLYYMTFQAPSDFSGYVE